MLEILLVRHGETHWNREGRVQGYHADSPLTETGLEQARALARRMAAEALDALYSSDLGRTRQTVAPIVQSTRLQVNFDSRLRERNYGTFEGRTFLEVERDFPEAYAHFRTRDPHFAAAGGESTVQFHDRVIMALESIASQAAGVRIAVVAHGGVLGVMYRHAMNIPIEAPRHYTVANASINRFGYERGEWRILEWGDVSHLPATSLDDL
jgi:probable phosphoglycerate mutase